MEWSPASDAAKGKKAVVRSSGRRRAMAVKKPRMFGKILTGILTTIVAPALASVVAQQVVHWQDTVKFVVENNLPGYTADWTQPTPADSARHLQAGAGGRQSAPPAVLM